MLEREHIVVTTEEELSALGVGAIVTPTLYGDVDGRPVTFQRLNDGNWHRGGQRHPTPPEHILPATVLYKAGE